MTRGGKGAVRRSGSAKDDENLGDVLYSNTRPQSRTEEWGRVEKHTLKPGHARKGAVGCQGWSEDAAAEIILRKSGNWTTSKRVTRARETGLGRAVTLEGDPG